MRILLLVDVYIPVAQAAAVMMHDLAVELKSKGHEVRVMTPAPGLHAPFQVEEIEGIEVVRVKTPAFKEISRASDNRLLRKVANIKRGLREGQLSKVMWKNAATFLKNNPSDMIVYYAPSIFFGDLVARLKRTWNARSYLILRDIFPQWLVDAGEISPLHPGLWFLRHKERVNYRAADIIALQSPANRHYFDETGYGHGKNFDVLFNWTDSKRAAAATGRYRKKYGFAPDDVIFFFGGTFTEAQDMNNLVRLASRMQDIPQVKFLFVGKGPYYAQIEADIQNKNLSNITLAPAVGHTEFMGVMADIDVGLITLNRKLKTHNVPGKLLDYTVFGKPVLASFNPGNDAIDVINEAQGGFAFENGQDQDLETAARKLAQNAELRATLGKNSQALQQQKFSVQSAATQILSYFSDDHIAQK